MKNRENIQRIFSHAHDIKSPAERESYLDQACAGDARLRAEVQELLDLVPAIGADFLGGKEEPLQAEGVGSRIGPYTLLRAIGEGGMGTVFLAEQREPVRRKVALKIVKTEVNSRQVLARFDAERQALALMDHPNIAKIYDAGTTEFRNPYFVMELVDGVPITAYCDAAWLPVRERLVLFAQVCKAIQHAHEKGVIHRDIKPSNVLVAVHDGVPVPKVIDFGVAKAVDQKLSNQTLTTQLGALIGTLEYMSPEQADLSTLGVDARSDIYSLGVLLYELLTGATPLDAEHARAAAILDTLKTIREVEPPKPSTRIAEAKERLNLLADRRGTTAGVLVKQVRGELDWIAMKALDKDRERRYESAAGLGRDIERYLKDEPVEASPPGRWYRFSKFVRRNKVVVSAAAAVSAAVIGGLIASTWLYFLERAARGRAESAEATQSGLLKTAQAAEREANLRLCDARVAQGDAYGSSGQWIKARESYLQSWSELNALFEKAGPEFLPAQTGFLESMIRAPEPLMTFAGHRPSINTVAIHSDSNLLATGDAEGALRVWNLRTGSEIRSYSGHQYAITSVVFSKDGRRMLTGSLDQSAILWEVETGRQLHVYNQHHAAINGVAFSPDEKSMLIGCGDQTARLLSVETGGEIYKWPHDGWVSSVAFSPDGKTAATGSMDGKVRLWNVANGQLAREMKGNTREVLSVKFSPDGSRVVSSGGDGEAFAADAKSGDVLCVFKGHAAQATGIAVSPRGNMVFASGGDNTVRAWMTGNGRSINDYSITRRNAPFLCVAFSQDGTTYATGSADGSAQLWDVKALALAGPFSGFFGEEKNVTRLAVSRDGRLLVSASVDGPLKVWDTSTLVDLGTFEGLIQAYSASLSSDNNILVAGGSYGMIRAWELYSGKEVDVFLGHKTDVTSIAFLPNSHKFLSGARDGSFKLWDLDKKHLAKDDAVRIFEGHIGDPSADRIDDIQVDPSGNRAITISSYQIKFWNMDASLPVKTLKLTLGGHRARLLSDAHNLLTTSLTESSVELRDTDTDEIKKIYRGHTSPVTGMVTLPGERWMASGGLDARVRIFDLNSGAEVRSFECICPVTALACSPDGQTLFAGTDAGHIQRWDLASPVKFRDLERALPNAREALKKSADDAEGLRIFGEWYAFRGVPDWALDYLEKYKRIAGTSARIAPLMLGRCYLQTGKFAEALREFQAELEAPQSVLKNPDEEADRKRYLTLFIDAIKRKMSPAKRPAG